MMRSLFILFSIFLFHTTQAQRPFSRELWLNENNTPVRVNAVMQADDGIVWLGTESGLFRFNGRQFVQIPDSMRNAVTAIGGRGKDLWVGFQDGSLGKLENSVVKRIGFSGPKPSSAITSIFVAGDGIIYASTEAQGIFMIAFSTSFNFSTAQGLSDNFVYNIAATSDHSLLAVTDQGINELQYDRGNISVIKSTTSDGLPDNIVRVLTKTGKGRWWLGTQDGGICLYDEHSRSIIKQKAASWQWGQVNDILHVSDSLLYIATEEGNLVVAERKADSLRYSVYPYRGEKLRKLLLDKAGNIWCATVRGLIMITDLYAARLDPGMHYSLRSLTAMNCDRHNNIWYALEDSVYCFSPGSGQPARYVLKAPESITSLFADAQDNIWMGTLGKGLWKKDRNGSFGAVKEFENSNNAEILEIMGKADRLWVSSLNGVDEFIQENGILRKVRRHNKSAGLGSDYVYQVLPAADGKIWFATDGAGIAMYDGQYHHWNEASGMKSSVVYSITQDGKGMIWAGTREDGLYYLDHDKWYAIQRDEGLQDMSVSALTATATGQLIVVTSKGIDEWYSGNKQFRHYNRRLGLDIDNLSPVANCIARDNEGNVYVPYENGFIRFRNQDDIFNIRPGLLITSLSLFLIQDVTGSHSFAAADNHLSFQFEGINFANPERLFYRYKLDGYNDGWINTNDESVTFPQLPPGTYTFHVQASLNRSFRNVAEAEYVFKVALPFYRQPLFILIAIIIIGGLIYLYTRLRESSLRKMTQLQKERMIFEYEHLKSQVNPHFLFNSLNTLVNLIEEDRDAAINYTVELSDLYRTALSYRDRDLITLNEEWFLLEKYFYIQKSRFGSGLHWNVDVSEELMRTKQIVPLALQLLVENAIKHNVVSMSNPLWITITADEETITISNPMRPKLSKEKGAGLGIINIKKRYELLTREPVSFGIVNNHYIVKLPLL